MYIPILSTGHCITSGAKPLPCLCQLFDLHTKLLYKSGVEFICSSRQEIVIFQELEQLKQLSGTRNWE